MTYKGSCHCGAITYRVETDLNQLMRCNCSICARAGTLMTFVPEDRFELLTGADHYIDYQFGKKSTHHGFCNVCGVRPYATGSSDKGPMIMVNVGCLDGVNTADHANVMVYDGAAL